MCAVGISSWDCLSRGGTSLVLPLIHCVCYVRECSFIGLFVLSWHTSCILAVYKLRTAGAQWLATKRNSFIMKIEHTLPFRLEEIKKWTGRISGVAEPRRREYFSTDGTEIFIVFFRLCWGIPGGEWCDEKFERIHSPYRKIRIWKYIWIHIIILPYRNLLEIWISSLFFNFN